MNMPVQLVRPSVSSLVRACCSLALGTIRNMPPRAVAASNWGDSGADYLLRAAVPPATMGTVPALVQTIMPDFLAALAPVSAAAKIFQAGLQLTFDNAGQVNVPTLTGDPSFAAFVADGAPIMAPQI